MIKKVFAMIAKYDLPSFQKGDIISSKESTLSDHSSISNNPKFKLIEVTGTTKDEAEALLEPMIITLDGEQQLIYSRSLTVDVDVLEGVDVIDVDSFLALITKKTI